MGVFYSLYNVQLSYTLKNTSEEMCCNYYDLILGLEYQYVEIGRTTKRTFPVYKCMLGWWICTYFIHGHVRCCCIDMMPMCHHRFLNV